MASNDVDYAGGKHEKQSGSRCSRICRAIYNPQKKQLFGRTCSSWAKIGLFYLVFYSCLAGFFAIMMAGFFQTLSERTPTMTGMYSLIKQNPGMGFRPMPTTESTLIKFNLSEPESYNASVADIEKYLIDNNYINKDGSVSDTTTDGDGKALFDVTSLIASGTPCARDKGFGYSEGQPCVLLKVNRVIDWSPKPYANDTEEGKKYPSADNIAVTCEGENDGDIDFMGNVTFYPPGGFSAAYFPYTNADNYRGPLVFAKFTNPTRGVLLQIWCKMWAGNIKHHKNDKAGSVRFELLVDGPK